MTILSGSEGAEPAEGADSAPAEASTSTALSCSCVTGCFLPMKIEEKKLLVQPVTQNRPLKLILRTLRQF